MKNVLLVIKGLGRGGAERLLASGLRYIDPARFNVEVAYLLPWKDALVPDLRAQGVTVHLLESRRAFDVRWAFALRRLVRERRIDLVHTHMPFVGVGARLVVPRRDAQLMHTEHNLWSRYRAPTRVANLLTISRNREVIAVSAAVASSMQIPGWLPLSLPHVEIVRHGADLSSVRSGLDARAGARVLLGLDTTDRVVGTVGNFTPKKDHDTLLRAIASLVGSGSDLKLVLVGSGPLEAELRSRAESLGIGDRVLFTGMREDVATLLPAFDVFALSSRFEGLPIALLEAMAACVPTVATAVGGIPEVITDGTDGLLVEPGAADELAAAIDLMLCDQLLATRIAVAGAERSTTFDLATAIERTQAIYDTVLGVS